MPGIGFLRSFAKDGAIKDFASLGIDTAAIAGNYAPGILEIGQVDGKQYGLMVKFNSKSTVFYRPDVFTTAGVAEPKTWDEFKTAHHGPQGQERQAARTRRQGFLDAERLVREHLHPPGRA